MSNDVDISFDVRDVASIIWSNKWPLLGASFAAAILVLILSFMVPNIYRAETLLAPVDDSASGMSGLVGRLGGLANLAGMGFGGGDTSKIAVALEVLRSRSFLVGFVKKRDILVPLVAARRWDQDSGKLILDENIYDANENRWGALVDDGEVFPTDWAIYKEMKDAVRVVQSKETGMVSVSIDFFSPQLAAKWLDWLVEDLNEYMRQRDVLEAEKSIKYLTQQLEKTAVTEMQQIFYQLIEKQMQTIMLASARDQYVFEIIDPPSIPEEKQSPKRAIVVVLTFVLVFALYVFGLLFSRLFRQAKFERG